MCRTGFTDFFPQRDVLVAVLPFFHVYVPLLPLSINFIVLNTLLHWRVNRFGGVVISLAPLSIGVPLVILPKFVPQIFLETIQKYKITVSIWYLILQ